jgi:adenylyltransferase/sulfurtransferase
MDVVAGAVDNRLARYFVNRYCSMFAVPYVDAGMQELKGSVSAFKSDETACYECTLYDVDYEMLTDRYPCLGLMSDEIDEGKAPTTPTTSSIISGVQTQEIIKLLHLAKGYELPSFSKTLLGREFRYDGHDLHGDLYEIPGKESCVNEYCKNPIAPRQVTELDFTRNRTLRELEEEIRNKVGDFHSIILSTELLTNGRCPSCGESFDFYEPEKSVSVSRARCKKCGSLLVVETTRFLPRGSNMTLGDLKIPLGYVFQVTTPLGTKYVELTGDSRRDPELSRLHLA